MKFRLAKFVVLLLTVSCALSLWAGDAIPKIAWKRGIGEPLANPGTRKPQLNDLIDDGYWQGAAGRRFWLRHLLAHLPRRFFALAPESWHS